VNGTASNFTASYNVLYASSTTYKVDITDVLPTKTYDTTAWFLKDGTVIGLQINQFNLNSSASSSFQTYFSLWEKDILFGQTIDMYAPSSYLHSTGTSTVTAGPTTLTVTNYAPNSLPETIPGCSGQSLTLTSGKLSVGTPSGSSYPLATYLGIAGSETTAGTSGGLSTVTYNFVSQITSITVA
jgi:hypothetical protein